jgi:hypothetical protein
LVPFALLVAASRVILGLHYPTDVIAGATIGASLASRGASARLSPFPPRCSSGLSAIQQFKLESRFVACAGAPRTAAHLSKGRIPFVGGAVPMLTTPVLADQKTERVAGRVVTRIPNGRSAGRAWFRLWALAMLIGRLLARVGTVSEASVSGKRELPKLQ